MGYHHFHTKPPPAQYFSVIHHYIILRFLKHQRHQSLQKSTHQSTHQSTQQSTQHFIHYRKFRPDRRQRHRIGHRSSAEINSTLAILPSVTNDDRPSNIESQNPVLWPIAATATLFQSASHPPPTSPTTSNPSRSRHTTFDVEGQTANATRHSPYKRLLEFHKRFKHSIAIGISFITVAMLAVNLSGRTSGVGDL